MRKSIIKPCPLILSLLLFWTVTGMLSAALPQTQGWQVTLRNHLATLSAADFDITLAPLTYAANYLEGVDEVYRVWQWHSNRGAETTSDEGLRVASSHFTLANIEAGGQINMRATFVDPIALTWWSRWNYPGNPHRPGTANSLAAMKRAFVIGAVDLIMLNDAHSKGQNVRSDYMGGSLIRHAYVYYGVRDILPADVRTAYETGLVNIFTRIENATPHGSGGADMETFQFVSLWYVAEALDSDALRARALARVHVVLDNIMKPAGYEHHGHAFDSSYMGIALHFTAWAANLYNDDRLSATLDGMMRIKSHFTMPEPIDSGFTQRFSGPSHFNTGTGDSCHNDQWGRHFRDIACALNSDQALYLLYGGRNYTSWMAPLGIKSETQMRSDLANLNWRDNALKTVASTRTPDVWLATHWTSPNFNYTHEVYPSGFHQRATRLARENHRLTKPPFARSGNFVEAFANAFMALKIGEYGAILHTDVIRDSWAGHIAGLGGGGISAFWTPVTGAIMMGLNGGSQINPESWPQWTNWAVHAVSGENIDYKPFSSARISQPANIDYKVAGTTNVTLTFDGSLVGAMPAPNNALTGNVRYYRRFECDADGIRVRTAVTNFSSATQVRRLWEMIPIHLRLHAQPEGEAAEVSFRVGQDWWPASVETRGGVEAVRVTRFGESAYIQFSQPRTVRMAPEAKRRSVSWTWNLMVDMLGSGGAPVTLPASTAVEYRIFLPPAALRIEGLPNDYATPTPLGYGRHTNITFGSLVQNSVPGIIDEFADEGIRQVNLGWTLTDYRGAPLASGTTHQASFSLLTNSVLHWNWTNQYYLTLETTGPGTVSAASGWRGSGQTLAVHANPHGPHRYFDRWQGDTNGCIIDGATITVAMDQPRRIEALFYSDTYSLEYSAGANGGIEGHTTQTVDYGQDGSTVTARPDHGYHFTHWSDGLTGAERRDQNVTNDISVTAWFAPNPYSLQVESAHGNPDPAVGPHVYPFGTLLTNSVGGQTVFVNGGTQIVAAGWTMAGHAPAAGTGQEFVMTLTNDAVLTWIWTTNYWLTTVAGDHGQVIPVSGWFAAHSNVTIAAVADPHHYLDAWSGDIEGAQMAGDSITVMLDRPRRVEAAFALNRYAVTYLVEGQGTIDGETDQTIGHGADGTIVTAQPAFGYHFTHWSDGLTEPERRETNVTSNLTLTAWFAPDPLVLRVESVYGNPDPAVGDHASYYGAVLTNTVDAAVTGGEGTQYVAVGWSMLGNEPAGGAGNSMAMTMTNDAVLTWNWNTQVWFAADAGGQFGHWNDVLAQTGWHLLGTTVTATAVASPGFRFLEWVGDVPEGMAHANPVDVAMDRSKNLVAHFTNVVTLVVESAHGGCVPPPGLTTNDWGTLIPALAVTDAVQQQGGTQWVAVGWTGSGSVPAQGHGIDAGPVILTNDSAIAWIWQTNYWLAVENTQPVKGLVLVYTNAALAGTADMAVWTPRGTEIRIEAAASNYFRFLMWDGDLPAHADPSDPVLIFAHDRPRAVSAVFEQPDAVSLTVVSAHGGSVPEPGTAVYAWGTQLPALAVIQTPQEYGGTQYVAVGWSGGGSVPPSGTGPDAGPVRLTNDSLIAWHWATNYWLDIAVGDTGEGDVLVELEGADPRFGDYAAWTPVETSLRIEAVAAHGFRFQYWEGNLPAESAQAAVLELAVDQARSLTPVFEFLPPDGTGGLASYVSPAGNHIHPFTNWVSAARDIQSAVDAAGAGDTIWVHDGVFDTGGKAVFGAMTNRVALDKAVAVRGVNGPSQTLIVGQGPIGATAVRCAYVGPGAVLSGFTLTNGHTLAHGDNIHERSGGGAWCAESGLIADSVIAGNSAVWRGGGIYGGKATGCLVQANTARDGGGVYATTLEYSRLLDNVAAQQGGGAWGSVLRNVRISGNTAIFGGGVYQGTLYNCEVTANEANSGGGVYDAVVESSTLTANRAVHAQGYGGGAFSATILNSIVYANTAPNGANSSGSHFSHSCTTPLPTGPGNIAANPGFVDPSGGDFRPVPDSPCIDAGQNQAWMETATDLDGHPRIMFMQVDMGCYESVFAHDVDGDGLPDWWESYYFGGVTNAMPAVMAANQVHTLLEAYVAGLDPHDPAAAWGVGAVMPVAWDPSGERRITLSWPSRFGRLYAVDWMPEWGAEPQRIADNLTATPPRNIFTDPQPRPDSQGFYVIYVSLE